LRINTSTLSVETGQAQFDSRPDEVVDLDDPQMPAKVNAGWWRMVTEYQVLDERREVLLSVDYSDPDEIEYAWVRVRLADHWDLAGSGSINLQSGFAGLFTDRFEAWSPPTWRGGCGYRAVAGRRRWPGNAQTRLGQSEIEDFRIN